jgi:hypothetical protein
VEIRHIIANDFRGLMRTLWEDDCVQSQHKKRILERLLAKEQKKGMDNNVVTNIKGLSMETSTITNADVDRSSTEVKEARAVARSERGRLRKRRAVEMMKQHGTDVGNRSGQVGNIVSIAMDKKHYPNGRGLLGIVFARADSGGCCVVTKRGIISDGKGSFWIPVHRYKVLPDDIPVKEVQKNWSSYVQSF